MTCPKMMDYFKETACSKIHFAQFMCDEQSRKTIRKYRPDGLFGKTESLGVRYLTWRYTQETNNKTNKQNANKSYVK